MGATNLEQHMTHPLFEGKTALVAGASSGISLAFAEALAKRGTHIILVARTEEQLHPLAATLSRVNAVQIDILRAHLHAGEGAQHVYAKVKRLGRQVDILITDSTCDGRAPEDTHAQAGVSEALLHAVFPQMVLKGRGVVIQIAPLTSAGPLPPLPTVSAWLLSRSRALWSGGHLSLVQVLALSPGCSSAKGVTLRALHVGALLVPNTKPERLAASALRVFERGRSSIVPGLLQALFVRVMAGKGRARLTERAARHIPEPPRLVPLARPDGEEQG